MSSSSSMTTDTSVTRMDKSEPTSDNNQTNVLPDTGQTSSQVGLLGAITSVLAGIGLLKSSKKQKDEKPSSK
ncbi:TPA: LPXTG cell wall anchor domain-containing protein [Staphylococcus delphini]|nr:LPXTG cell wall anchor domain-containing protein [Staphylococcus delphini]HEC2203293.1 LPXTG cell wall anchor domain-containing protein [Staphylococcus delphini]